MKIEKLNDDKIRIILNIEDLEKNNIDLHSFMSNSIESQDLFLDMLDKAEEELGFITEDYKIRVETLATSNGSFILTLTRLPAENEKEKLKRKKVHIKRKENDINTNKTIYMFTTFDDFCEFCNSLDVIILDNIHDLAKNISLYSYQSSYYLVLSQINLTSCIVKKFCSLITEFAKFINHSELFERKLFEYGETVIQQNAISLVRSIF